MGESHRGIRGSTFAAWVLVIVLVGVVQSIVHLAVVLGSDRIGTLVDLDRSNGLPDLASSIVLAAAAVGAAALASVGPKRLRLLTATLGVTLAALTLADVVHDGPHPSSAVGWSVIAVVAIAGPILGLIAAGASGRVRATLVAAVGLLAASFFINALDQIDAQRFERERGDSTAEYQIVAKEGLELLGWSFVALALWDETLRRRRARGRVVTTPASPGRAASRRRAA